MKPIRLTEKFSQIDQPWSPRVVAALNGQEVKLAKLEGEFIWHAHEDEDELFLVISGELEIELREDGVEKSVTLAPGELVVVPRGVEHRPIARQGAEVLLFEPSGTVNTGTAGGERTVENPEWL